MKKHFVVTLTFLMFLALGVSLGVLLGIRQENTLPVRIATTQNSTTFAPLENSPVPSPHEMLAPSPLPQASPSQQTSTEWTSPNGKSILVMKVTPDSESTLSTPKSLYSFYVKTSSEPTERLVFRRSLKQDEHFTLPFNSWSPDNKYFFIQEQTKNALTSYVFTSSGKSFSDGELFLDVNALFAEKNLENTLKEVTGWAAPALLIGYPVGILSWLSSAP